MKDVEETHIETALSKLSDEDLKKLFSLMSVIDTSIPHNINWTRIKLLNFWWCIKAVMRNRKIIT